MQEEIKEYFLEFGDQLRELSREYSKQEPSIKILKKRLQYMIEMLEQEKE